MSEQKFADGIRFFDPHQNAPDFVLGTISIQPNNLRAWLDQQKPDEKGFIRLDVKRAKSGNPYVALNTYQKRDKPVADHSDDDLIPF